jgi:hypothetical protein
LDGPQQRGARIRLKNLRAEITAEANRKSLTLGNICLKTNRNGASQMAGTREAKKKIGLIQHLIAQA